ncbi:MULTISPECIES: hypothetical protein [Enterobacterales]|nr:MULTISPECIES: hypothetical protein [Enterobacterales]ELB1544940.1 hypothetical protein [Morganella morganii]MEB1123116.1 hypothetical protein [Citrobacter freundii]HAZ8046744.1 hypothetical protein [Escherichia coli]MBN6360059.1 hypothetical protein [Providencia huaxiensis]MBQ0536418.1 hypothetical protein [Providencia huaxiensis]
MKVFETGFGENMSQDKEVVDSVTTRKTRRKKVTSVPSSEYQMHLDTTIAIDAYHQRFFVASQAAYLLEQRLERCLMHRDKIMRDRAAAIMKSLNQAVDSNFSDIENYKQTLAQVIAEVEAERGTKYELLSYSTPRDMTIENRTYLATRMCSGLETLDLIIKYLDVCRHYSLVPLAEILETQITADKRIRGIFSTIIRHGETMKRLEIDHSINAKNAKNELNNNDSTGAEDK